MAGESIRFNASLSTTGFDSGAARLQQIAAQTSGKVSASFAAMGARIAAVVAPIMSVYAAINAFKGALDMGGRLNDLSKTTGETAGNLAILERAFANAGVGGERLAPALTSLASFVTDLANQMPSAQMAASQLGLSFDDLRGKTPIEQMRILLAAIADIENPTTRAALAVDVFKKAGRDIVPLARDFSGELANARGELGSLPRILDENAASLDDLGDKLGNAVGNKLTELAAGLAAGATGAANLADGLAKIDAAGIGERLGESLRMAFAAPLEILQGAGDFLISGFLKAGNLLVASLKYAFEIFANLFSDAGFWSGIRDRAMGALARAAEGFSLALIKGVESALRALGRVPFLGDFAAQAIDALQPVKQALIDAGIAASNTMDQGAMKITAAWNNATKASRFMYEDFLGADQYAKSAEGHIQRAAEAAAAMKESSQTLADNFGMGANALVSALDALRGFNAKRDAIGGGEDSPFPSFTRGGGADMTGVTMPAPASSDRSIKINGTERNAPKSFAERVAEMRGQARQSIANQRAAELEARGMFDAAVRAQMRGERAFERTMTSEQLRQAVARFAGPDQGRGARNIGELISGLGGTMATKDMLAKQGYEFDRTKSLEENVKQHLLNQSKTSSEKTQEEQGRGVGGAGASRSEVSNLDNTAQQILEAVNSINEKLPQNALS